MGWGLSLAQTSPQNAGPVDRLQIERFGGITGAGPDARFQSRGEVLISDLSPADQRAVNELFNETQLEIPRDLCKGGQKDRRPHKSIPDEPYYCITRGGNTVRVPESAVPPALIETVPDALK